MGSKVGGGGGAGHAQRSRAGVAIGVVRSGFGNWSCLDIEIY